MVPVQSLLDTIVAPITAPGRAAVAAIRVSGPEAFRVARKAFPSLPDPPVPRHAQHGRFQHGDDGIALPYEAGASYTGEPTVELFVHGSPTSVRLLVDGCLAAGARLAEPGEFTLRAFANGRIDLTQAEAVSEVVDAQTAAHLRGAGAQLAGAIGRSLEPALRLIEEAIVRLEASLDFGEEVGHPAQFESLDAVERARRAVSDVRSWERPSALVRDGLRVAIMGRPNAGKSSLFNALAGSERAIVTEIPGTTRDVLEATIDVRGIPMTLFDTAGLRAGADVVEAIGIRRAHAAAQSAHAVVYLYDCTLGLTDEDRGALAELDDPLLVATKADLPHATAGHLETSSVTGLGISELLGALVRTRDEIELPYVLNERHAACLAEADDALLEARAAIAADAAPDLVLPALYAAAASLRQILGLGVGPDVIEQIFARFCIGK